MNIFSKFNEFVWYFAFVAEYYFNQFPFNVELISLIN